MAKKNQTYYGIYGFRTGSGDCYVMASTFYWMAKVAGYNAHYVTGYVNKGKGNGPHAWVEIMYMIQTSRRNTDRKVTQDMQSNTDRKVL